MAKREREQIQEPASTYYGADTRGCPVERVSELIRIRAYQLFEARGHFPGRELDDWLEAERELNHHLNFR